MIIKYDEQKALAAGVTKPSFKQMRILGIKYTDYDPWPFKKVALFRVSDVPVDLPAYITIL